MNISPIRVSAALHYIANKIDNSDCPSKLLVVRDLTCLSLAMEGRSQNEVLKLAYGEAETNKKLSELLWSNPEGRSVDEAYGMAKKIVDDEKLITALNSLKSSISDFVTHLEHGVGKGQGKKTVRQQIKEEEESGDVVTSAPPTSR